MARRSDSDPNANVRIVLLVVLVVAVLSAAREVILPLAIAALFTFLLSPVVTWLDRRRVNRVAAVLAVVLLVMLIVMGIGWTVADQLIALGGELPEYKDNLIARVRAIRGPLGTSGGPLADTFAEVLNELQGEPAVEDAAESAAGSSGEAGVPPAAGEGAAAEAVPVRIVQSEGSKFGTYAAWLGPLLSPFGTAAVVAVFTIFMLLQRDDLRDRLIRLGGTQRLNLTTQALDEAGQRVSRYLLMLLVINGSYGLVIWLGLTIIGLPHPALWGLLAATMRFIPFIGPWLAAILPIALSLAVDDGWGVPAATIGLFVGLELFSNNVLEPLLFGRSTGVSVVGIIAAASFWTWLWGPMGLVLSLPLTVCLVVIGRYVPQLEFFNILLGDAPALDVKYRYYQRLLALDYHEAGEIADQQLKESSVEQLYTEVLAPALSLAERDRHSGELVESQREFIYQTIRETIDELGERPRTPEEAGAEPGVGERVELDDAAAGGGEGVADAAEVGGEVQAIEPLARSGARVWCVPAEDDADEIAGTMFAQLLTAHGYTAEALPAAEVNDRVLGDVAADAADALLVSAVAPGGVTHARRLCKRLRPKRRKLTIIIGLWNASGPLEQTRARLAEAGATAVATTLQEALEVLSKIATADRPPDPSKLEPAAAAGR